MFPRACRVAAISPLSCAWQALRPAAIAIAPTACLTLFLRREFNPAHAMSVIAEMAVVGLVYLAAVWTVGLDGMTRATYRHVIAGITRRGASATATA